MAQQKESELISRLQEVRDAGGEFLNALYVYRSIQRALPDATNGEDVREAVLAIVESGLGPLSTIQRVRDSICNAFREAVEFLALVDGLTSSDLRASLIQTLGLVHLLDGVKDNKVSIQRDFSLYEDTLRMQNSPEEDSERESERHASLKERLARCRKLREVFTSRWWFMNGLLVFLPSVAKAADIMADLMDLLSRAMCCEEDGSGPVFLPHDRYKLLRALPIILYLYHFLSKRIAVTEPIPAKLMESCLKLLKRYPVVPGVGDYAVVTYVPILGILFMPGGPYAKDMKRLSVTSLDELDKKYLEHLEREYSLATHHLQVRRSIRCPMTEYSVPDMQVRDIHDHLCDTLTRFVKESMKWREAGESMPLSVRLAPERRSEMPNACV